MMISPAHVNDVGEGIALAAEKGRIDQGLKLLLSRQKRDWVSRLKPVGTRG